jgi:hypothetical protein
MPAIRFFKRTIGVRGERRVEFAVVVHPGCNDRSLTAACLPVKDTLR